MTVRTIQQINIIDEYPQWTMYTKDIIKEHLHISITPSPVINTINGQTIIKLNHNLNDDTLEYYLQPFAEQIELYKPLNLERWQQYKNEFNERFDYTESLTYVQNRIGWSGVYMYPYDLFLPFRLFDPKLKRYPKNSDEITLVKEMFDHVLESKKGYIT